MVIADNKDLVRSFFEEVFNKRDVAAIDEFVAADQIDHTLPPNLPPTTAGTKQGIDMFLRAFPDVHITLDDVIAERDRVAVRFTSRGTQRGAFAGLPATGRQVTVPSYLIARIADGKIVEQWGLDDRLGMLQQLGIIPGLLGAVLLVGFGAGMGVMALLRWGRRESGPAVKTAAGGQCLAVNWQSIGRPAGLRKVGRRLKPRLRAPLRCAPQSPPARTGIRRHLPVMDTS